MRAEPLLGAILLCCACGSGRAQPERPDPAIARAQAEAAKRRIEALEQELVEARARLNQTGPAAAAPPPRAPGLQPGDGFRLELGTARYVERPGEAPRPRSLAEHVGHGRGAVFALWATWCKPCIADEELVLLRDLQARLPPDFPLISMACDGMDDVRTHAKAGRFVHPVWQIDDGHLAILPQAFIQQHGLGLPLFLIVGADGTLKAWRNKALDPYVVDEILAATR